MAAHHQHIADYYQAKYQATGNRKLLKKRRFYACQSYSFYDFPYPVMR